MTAPLRGQDGPDLVLDCEPYCFDGQQLALSNRLAKVLSHIRGERCSDV